MSRRSVDRRNQLRRSLYGGNTHAENQEEHSNSVTGGLSTLAKPIQTMQECAERFAATLRNTSSILTALDLSTVERRVLTGGIPPSPLSQSVPTSSTSSRLSGFEFTTQETPPRERPPQRPRLDPHPRLRTLRSNTSIFDFINNPYALSAASLQHVARQCGVAITYGPDSDQENLLRNICDRLNVPYYLPGEGPRASEEPDDTDNTLDELDDGDNRVIAVQRFDLPPTADTVYGLSRRMERGRSIVSETTIDIDTAVNSLREAAIAWRRNQNDRLTRALTHSDVYSRGVQSIANVDIEENTRRVTTSDILRNMQSFVEASPTPTEAVNSLDRYNNRIRFLRPPDALTYMGIDIAASEAIPENAFVYVNPVTNDVTYETIDQNEEEQTVSDATPHNRPTGAMRVLAHELLNYMEKSNLNSISNLEINRDVDKRSVYIDVRITVAEEALRTNMGPVHSIDPISEVLNLSRILEKATATDLNKDEVIRRMWSMVSVAAARRGVTPIDFENEVHGVDNALAESMFRVINATNRETYNKAINDLAKASIEKRKKVGKRSIKLRSKAEKDNNLG